MDNSGDTEKKKLEAESDAQVEETYTVEPPDGGWGWVIVFASFMCNVIVDGIIFSYGLFLQDLSVSFGETKGRLAWVGSILAGFYLIAGPVVSGLANTYGCRPVAIIGAFVSAASFCASAFATSMECLCITFGLLGGIGFGFIYLPAVVTVGYYFERRRALATGLAVCGSGVGTFVMAPLVKYFLEEYGWRGTMLLLSGIVLHCAIFGTLFRPLEPKRKTKPQPKPAVPLLQRIKEYRENLKKWDSGDLIDSSMLPEKPISSSLPQVNQCSQMLISNEKLCDKSTDSPTGSNNSPPPSYSEVVGEEIFSFLNSSSPNVPMKVKNLSRKKPVNTTRQRQYSLREDYLRPFYRQDILYSASLLHLPEFRSQPDLEHYHMSITKIPEHADGKESSCCFSPVMKETFKQMLDLSLLKSPTFLFFGVAGFLTLAGFFVPFMFIIDRAVLCGVSPDEAPYILSAIGFTNTVGRVFSGWASDRPNLKALSINNLALVIGGLITILSPFMNSFLLLMSYGAVFGFAIAGFATLRSIIVVELLGLEKLTNAFGLLLLFQGIASIIGSPVAGMFYDITGSYDASFYIAGTLILISGLLGIPLPYISRWENRRKNRKALACDHQIIVTNESDLVPHETIPQPEAV